MLTPNTEEKKSAINTFAKFGKDYQRDLVQIIFEDRVFADQISEVIDVSFFESKCMQLFLRKLLSHREEYGVHPSFHIMVSVIQTQTADESESLRGALASFLAHIKANPNPSSADYIKEKALEFFKKQKLQEALIKSVGLIQESSYDKVAKLINDSLNLGTNVDYGHDYEVDIEERYQIIMRHAIPTGWERLDKIQAGGLGRRELGIVIAPTGGGKSMVLAAIGANALREGKRVVHYTLELLDIVVARRYDSCLSGVPLNDLFQRKEAVVEAVTAVDGKLLVKEYPTKSATTMTIKSHMESLVRKGEKPDLVIVDYADILKPISSRHEKRNELESIYEELRGLASEFDCPVWTATQTNRTGLNQEVITMAEISEAFNKCFVADFIMTLSRTLEDKTTNTGRIYVAKNRNGPDGILFPIYMDTSKVEIKVLKEDHGAIITNDQIVSTHAQTEKKTKFQDALKRSLRETKEKQQMEKN